MVVVYRPAKLEEMLKGRVEMVEARRDYEKGKGWRITIYAPMIYTAPCIMFWSVHIHHEGKW